MNKTLDNPLTEPQALSAVAPGEVVLATVRKLLPGKLEIEFYLHGQQYFSQALTTQQLQGDAIGRQVVISFINGDIQQPIVLGLLHSALYELLENFHMEAAPQPLDANTSTTDCDPGDKTALPIQVDGKQVVIEAEQQLQFKCGDASITLTREGKILIRGKYLLNRASGVNRIIGGSVQVN